MINEYTENLDYIKGGMAQKVLGGIEGLNDVGNFYDYNERLLQNIEHHCQITFINGNDFTKEEFKAYKKGLDDFSKFFSQSFLEMQELDKNGLKESENDVKL